MLYCVSGYRHNWMQVERVLLEKLIVPQPVKELTAICGSRRFIIVLITACHLFLS